VIEAIALCLLFRALTRVLQEQRGSASLLSLYIQGPVLFTKRRPSQLLRSILKVQSDQYSLKEKNMKTTTGLWIDHKKAVIVTITDKGEEIKEITSHVEKQPGRFEGVRSTTPYPAQLVPADDSQQRGFTGHLDKYYDEVISQLRDAELILIFGPGEAKGELAKRIRGSGLGNRVAGIETVDKMTDRQIAAKVRTYLKETVQA
jgi:hypothetical protein